MPKGDCSAIRAPSLPCSFALLVPPLCFLLPPRTFLALQLMAAVFAMYRVRIDCACCYLQLAHARAELER